MGDVIIDPFFNLNQIMLIKEAQELSNKLPLNMIHPKFYLHCSCFVVLCCAIRWLYHSPRGYFIDIGVIIWFPSVPIQLPWMI